MSKITKTRIARTGYGDELVVKAYGEGGERLLDADYFTDDREDAESTAEAMVEGGGQPPADEVTVCPACAHFTGFLMGFLGDSPHYRCRGCGWTFAAPRECQF